MLICPVCSAALRKTAHAFCCEKGHSFDLSASGYCNLLTGSKAGRFIGDNKDMVAARRRFLESGTYDPLRRFLCEELLQLLTVSGRPVSILDAGCGEGYYTRAVAEAASHAGLLKAIIGADISKAATQYAAKRDRVTQYITASSYHLPIASGSVDLLLSLFAPAPADEFSRILAPAGTVLQVVPGAEHLWELKQAVYENPYENREEKHTLDGFSLKGRKKLCYSADIHGADLIQALFSMTPYAHRTPKEGHRRLEALTDITTTLSFVLLFFGREENPT